MSTSVYKWDGDLPVSSAHDQEVSFGTDYFESPGNLKKLYGFIVVFNGKSIATPTYDYVDRNGDLTLGASAITGGNTSGTVADLVGSYDFDAGPLECYSFRLHLSLAGTTGSRIKIKKVIFKYRVIHDEPGTL